MTNYKQNIGFTLIELLIVIAILGILISLALPSYQNYTNKAKFSEVINATSPYKLAAEVAYQTGTKIIDLNSGENGIPDAINEDSNNYKYLTSITIEEGIITAISKKILDDDISYILIANEDKGRINWILDESSSCLNFKLC